MLNWIVWNRNVFFCLTWFLSLFFEIETVYFCKTELFEIEMFLDSTVSKTKGYLCLTELFETELFIGIKMDLALNKLKWLMCYKTKPN